MTMLALLTLIPTVFASLLIAILATIAWCIYGGFAVPLGLLVVLIMLAGARA